VVYVDNDPIVLAHARALLTSAPEGRTAYIDADFNDPESIIGAQQTKDLIDFSRPVALLVVALLHFLPDSADPAAVLDRYKEVLAPGSALILTHGTGELMDPEVAAAISSTYTQAGLNIVSRTRAQVQRFFDGFDLVEPGVVPVHEWRPEAEEDFAMTREEIAGYAGVALRRG